MLIWGVNERHLPNSKVGAHIFCFASAGLSSRLKSARILKSNVKRYDFFDGTRRKSIKKEAAGKMRGNPVASRRGQIGGVSGS